MIPVAAAALLMTTAPVWAVQDAPAPAGSERERAVARGDSLMRSFDTAAAARAYAAGLEANPEDPVLLWKASRALATLAHETPGDEGDEQRLQEAIRLARRAVAAGPRVARTHTTLAASLGLYGRLIGHKYRIARAREVIEIGKEVRASAQRAIQLDPKDFAPYVIFGIWHRELATVHPLAKMVARTFLGGYPDVSLEESAAYLEVATRLAPDDVTTRVELAKTYLAMDRPEAARRMLRAAIAAPASERLDRIEQSKARAMLADAR